MPIYKRQTIRALFWGMPGEFSFLVLEGLLKAGINFCGLVISAAVDGGGMNPIIRLEPDPPHSQLPMNRPYLQRSITQLAWQNQVPVFEVRDLSSPAIGSELAALDADLAIVACFPRRIPEHILAIPSHGFINLHPSLLPEFRGPFPLFWFFRSGQQHTGISVHYMDAGLDTGDIALQQELSLPYGISGPQADALFATYGVSLLQTAYYRISSGTLSRKPQRRGGSRYSRPSAQDFHIPTSWSARRAYNFICGTAEWRQPYRISGPGIDRSFRQALSFDTAASQQEPILCDGHVCWIQFRSGLLHAR